MSSEEVVARAEWIVCAYSTCFERERPLLVVGEHLREDQQAVERRAQLVRHVREELGLVLRDERELLRLLLEGGAGLRDLAVLHLEEGRLAR